MRNTEHKRKNKLKDPHVKFGIFYYNPGDERELERRNGRGITVNFASRAGRRMFLMILLPGAVVVLLVVLAVILLKH